MDSSGERFRASDRLQKRPQFLEARRQGRRAEGRWVVVYARRNEAGGSRLGVTVSKRVGNAVVRNRWKRRLREVFRRNKERFGESHDVVIIVKRTRQEPCFDELLDDVHTTVKRALRERRRRREKR